MGENYLTIKRFTEPHLAEAFIEFLKSENIPYLIEDASPQFDVSFANNPLGKEIHVKVKSDDFENVEKLLIEREKDVSLEDIPKGYYLLDFSNEELIEILLKPDEWSPLDYNLARKVLAGRGKEVDPEFIETLRKKRNEELSMPEKSQKNWIFAGYLFAFFGGLLGLFIGWHLWTFKKTLPDGTRKYGYILSDRKNGRNILFIGLFMFVIEFIIWFKENGGFE